MTRSTSTLIGFLLAPLVAGVCLASLELFRGEFHLFFLLALGSYPFTLIAAFVFGMPVHLFLGPMQATWQAYAMSGAVIGIVVKLILQFPGLDTAAMFGVAGAAAAVSLCLIVRMGKVE